MSQQWDDKLKRIISAAAQDFVSWLLPGGQFIESLSLEVKTLTRTIKADTLHRVRLNGELVILHVEFQKRIEKNLQQRVWEYNVMTTLTYDCTVYSFVIYLMPGGVVPASPFTQGLAPYPTVHVFHYTNIKLWDITMAMLRGTGLRGLLPLFVLTKDGKQREVASEVFEELKDEEDKLSLAITLASMVFVDESDQQWLKRRVAMLEEIIRETWFYQDILQQGLFEGKEQGLKEGREKGIEEGRQEGIEEGRQEGIAQGKEQVLLQQQLMVLNVVQERFPSIAERAKQTIDAIFDPATLILLVVKMGAAQTEEEVLRSLREFDAH